MMNKKQIKEIKQMASVQAISNMKLSLLFGKRSYRFICIPINSKIIQWNAPLCQVTLILNIFYWCGVLFAF